MSRPFLNSLLIAIGLLAGTYALYRPALGLGFFHLDDQQYVVENPLIRGGVSNAIAIATTPYFANYSPMHLYSYAIDYGVDGLDARVFHVSSVHWAGMVAVFVALLGAMLTGSWLAGAAAGLLFALHPAHVEAVAWISSRKDLVAAAFAIPSAMAYLMSRRSPRRTIWLAVSVAFFLLAVAGKMSVVVLPGLFWLHDVLVERRRFRDTILDKIPYALIAVYVAVMTFGAQPDTRRNTDVFQFASVLVQNLWLLTGLGDYVIYRPAPGPSVPAWQFFGSYALALLAVVLPLALLRRLNRLAVTLWLWMLVAFIPSQILGFMHPVSDRYLFFPSVMFCILVAWALAGAARRWGRPGAALSVATIVILAAIWARAAQSYLAEWADPRSVWYAAVDKSRDANSNLYLGNHFQDMADQIAAGAATNATRRGPYVALAGAMWAEDSRRMGLIDEWTLGAQSTNTAAFRNFLLDAALEQFDLASARQGNILLPNLYYRRGKMALDRGNFAAARKEFQRSMREAADHSSKDVRDELHVRCAFAFGVLAWRERNYSEAMTWLDRADARQRQVGGNWVPDLALQKQRLAPLLPPPAAKQP